MLWIFIILNIFSFVIQYIIFIYMYTFPTRIHFLNIFKNVLARFLRFRFRVPPFDFMHYRLIYTKFLFWVMLSKSRDRLGAIIWFGKCNVIPQLKEKLIINPPILVNHSETKS